jgi:hypothetical protein
VIVLRTQGSMPSNPAEEEVGEGAVLVTRQEGKLHLDRDPEELCKLEGEHDC